MSKPDDIPACPNVPVTRATGQVAREYQVELLTPLFGGGVEPRVTDSSFPIRPTAIRGQLQFWWRATVGAQYATKERLREEQTKVWGGVDSENAQASKVQIRVELLDKPSEPKVCAVIKPNRKGRDQVFWEPTFQNTALPYALFPFQGKPANRDGPKVDPASCIHNATFRLTMICDTSIDFVKQVEPALWAWVNFGGLGSRTRRGCGAVGCKDVAPSDADDLKAAWRQYMPKLYPLRDWPTLAEAILIDSEQPNGMAAWDQVIERFKHFRQGVGLGRNGDSPKYPKRSHWPEPETVRSVTCQRLPKHASQHLMPNDAFPRAEFGLPIVFHFKDEDKKNAKNPKADPSETVLYPDADANGDKRERMASPLILKPLVLANGRAVPLILRLKTPGLAGVDLRQKVEGQEQSVHLPNPTHIRGASLATYTNSPLAGSPNGSALEAFLAHALTQGFTEVSR